MKVLPRLILIRAVNTVARGLDFPFRDSWLMQDGKIGLESKPGVGTRFYFQIPYAVTNYSHHSEIASPSGHVSEGLKGISILLVEDNDFNKIVAEDTLQEYIGDIKIDHAYNGVIALEKVRDNTYDLILMDIQMPEMDGY
ncbi:MAG: response regulator [Bacteroidetes bacterium]|nr:response regulator [Bacteroidota bacterium]